MAETKHVFFAAQVQRLGIFREFQFLNSEALREYRKWLEARCLSKEQAVAVIDAAVELETLPTLADLSRIHARLYPPVEATAAPSREERQATGRFLHEWYAQEEAEAEKRKAAFAEMARRSVSRPRVKLPWPLS